MRHTTQRIMGIYSTMSMKEETCFYKDLNGRSLLNDSVDTYSNTNINDCTSVLKKTFRTVPNILRNSARLRRINKAVEIYDTSEKRAETHVMNDENKKQQKRVSPKKQELLPLEALPFNEKKKNVVRSSKILRKRQKRINFETKGKPSVIVVEQKAECHSPDPNSDCQALSLLREIDERVLQDSVDFTSNEIFNMFRYEFNENNLYSPLDMISNELDSSCNINESSAMDINNNKYDTYQTAEDKNKENVSADKSISIQHLDTNNNCYCDSCFEYYVSEMIESEINNLQQNLLVETIDEDFQMNNTNEDTPISLIMEQGDFLSTDNDSISTCGDSNTEIVAETMFDTDMYVLCESCGMLFNQRDNFKKHLRICRWDQNFTCGMCKKAYRHKSSLYQHLKIKHYRPIDGLDSFTCIVCLKAYRRFGCFLNHITLHDNYL